MEFNNEENVKRMGSFQEGYADIKKQTARKRSSGRFVYN
jgi:hypothetical protein